MSDPVTANEGLALHIQLGRVGLIAEMDAAGLEPTEANQALVIELVKNHEVAHLDRAIKDCIQKIRVSN